MTSPGRPRGDLGDGVDYERLLLETMARLGDALASDAELLERMRVTFDNVVHYFEAEKALLLIPIIPDPPGGRLRFQILAATPQIKPTQLAAVRLGESAEGISASMIRTVVEAREAALAEHPMFLERAGLTAAAGAGDFSAMCAPVLDSTRQEIRALYYLQNTGSDNTKAYRREDLKFLIALTELLGRLFTGKSRLSGERRTR